MAQTEIMFYNLNERVGEGCPNLTDDVMLVQFFILEYFNRPPYIYTPQVLEGLSINGVFSSLLHDRIRDYQNHHFLTPDGRVDPITSGGIRASNRAHGQYTIAHMNLYVKTMNPSRFYNLAKDPAIPGRLQQALYDVTSS